MVNVGELAGGSPQQQPRRHRSPVLASSEVESAPMSDKCEIRRFDDAQQQQIGLVRPGDIADTNIVEGKVNTAQASGSSSPPPPDYSDYLAKSDEFKSLGTDRLHPPRDLNNPSGWQRYKAYLEEFYRFHKGPGPSESDAAMADAASKCLEKENNMKFWWDAKEAFSVVYDDILLSESIVGSMRTAIAERVDFLPFAVDAGPVHLNLLAV